MDLSGRVHHLCQHSKGCFFCSSLESVSFTPVDLKKNHNLKDESYDLFGGNFEDFKPRRQHLKLSSLVLFYVWEVARVWAHWNHSLDMQLSYLGPVSCILISWVSSGLTIGSGCSLMAARWQIFFSFLSFLRAFLTLESYHLWWLIWQEIFHFSDPLFLLRNLTNIWETFHDQILSRGSRRLIPDQVKILDMPPQALVFRLGPIDN